MRHACACKGWAGCAVARVVLVRKLRTSPTPAASPQAVRLRRSWSRKPERGEILLSEDKEHPGDFADNRGRVAIASQLCQALIKIRVFELGRVNIAFQLLKKGVQQFPNSRRTALNAWQNLLENNCLIHICLGQSSLGGIRREADGSSRTR